MKLFKSVFPLIGLLLLIGCEPASESEGGYEVVEVDAMEMATEEAVEESAGYFSGDAKMAMSANRTSETSYVSDQKAAVKPVEGIRQKLIWTAHIRYQVKNVDDASKQIMQMVEQRGGYISSMNRSSSSTQIRNDFEIRLKSDEIDATLNSLKAQAIHLDVYELKSQDVTEEFVDINSRLKTKKEARDRYIDILRNKAGKIKDILEAEEAIRKITEEIEAHEGRLRYLKNKVSYSTIYLSIYQEVEYEKKPDIIKKTFWDDIVEALEMGWNMLSSLVLFLITIWPILLIVIVLIVKRKRIFKARFNNKKEE